jgi:L-asparaginase II
MNLVSGVTPLAGLTRGPLLESVHHGIATAVDASGSVLESHGHAELQVYPRSAIKPLIALAMRRLGVELEGPELAITASSHRATPAHLALVARVLERYDLGFDALRCPPAWPTSESAARSVAAERPEYMNCSGKHAGFLAAAKINGWSLDDYLSPTHPVQLAVTETLREFAGEEPQNLTVDGCGAPLYSVSLNGLARSVARLMASHDPVVAAALANPWAISDHGRPDAEIMRHGYLAKIGAEGVFVIGDQSGVGVAVKIADGSPRVGGSVALKLLLNRGLIAEPRYHELRRTLDPEILGGVTSVGSLEVFI